MSTGTVAAARIEGGRGLATIQLSRADDARPIVDRIREGTLRSVSIGYQVLQSREERTNGMRTLVATRWRPRELSFVPIPADPLARVRDATTGTRVREMATLMGLPDSFSEALVAWNLTVEQARGEILAELRRSSPRLTHEGP